MDVCPLFIANTQATKLIQPGEGSFHYPAPSAQSAAMFSVAPREPRHDVAGTQTLPDCLRVITTVTQHAIRTVARMSALSLQGWDGINQCEGLL
jgi:hypothetical protein